MAWSEAARKAMHRNKGAVRCVQIREDGARLVYYCPTTGIGARALARLVAWRGDLQSRSLEYVTGAGDPDWTLKGFRRNADGVQQSAPQQMEG